MRKIIGGCISGVAAIVIASIGWGYQTSQEVAVNTVQIAIHKESIEDINHRVSLQEQRYLKYLGELNSLMRKSDKRITIMETLITNKETK